MQKLTAVLIVLVVITVIIIIVAGVIQYKSDQAADAGLPPGVKHGMNIRCDKTGQIYFVENHMKRWYPNEKSYTKAGNPSWVPISCTIVDIIPTGPDMPV